MDVRWALHPPDLRTPSGAAEPTACPRRSRAVRSPSSDPRLVSPRGRIFRPHCSSRHPEENVALPELTEEQRAAALEKAAAARRARAELKDRLKRGGTTIGEVLKQSDTDEVLGKMKVSALLEAMP